MALSHQLPQERLQDIRRREQPVDERDDAAVREALGEERFQKAWTEGQALTLEQAVAEARGEPG